MPELPEVETSCKGIKPYCLEQSFINIVIRQAKLRWPVDNEKLSQLKNQEVLAVERRGKYILLQTKVGALMIHLGMSGSLRVVESSVAVKKHDHVDFLLSNGKIIRYNDPRRFGSIIFNNQGELHPLLAKLGVEPLTKAFDADYLYNICQQRKVAIKVLIMNSHIVVGVGNIYAQEALFDAGIHPERAANRLAKKRIEKLVIAIKQILNAAIRAGGSSLKDFTSAEGKPGYFQQTLQVYGRANEACRQCQKLLKQRVIGQRSTVYCSQCQR